MRAEPRACAGRVVACPAGAHVNRLGPEVPLTRRHREGEAGISTRCYGRERRDGRQTPSQGSDCERSLRVHSSLRTRATYPFGKRQRCHSRWEAVRVKQPSCRNTFPPQVLCRNLIRMSRSFLVVPRGMPGIPRTSISERTTQEIVRSQWSGVWNIPAIDAPRALHSSPVRPSNVLRATRSSFGALVAVECPVGQIHEESHTWEKRGLRRLPHRAITSTSDFRPPCHRAARTSAAPR